MSPFATFAPLLRRRGFRKVFSTKSVGRVDIWSKSIDTERTVEVQVWGDGVHRVTHDIGGRSTTYPTQFWDEATLDHAIRHETTRRDNLNLADAA